MLMVVSCDVLRVIMVLCFSSLLSVMRSPILCSMLSLLILWVRFAFMSMFMVLVILTWLLAVSVRVLLIR